MSLLATEDIARVVAEVLQLGQDASLQSETQLLGGLPEFDSMAVVSILTRIEEDYGIIIDDDEISAETFETLGRLTEFVAGKL